MGSPARDPPRAPRLAYCEDWVGSGEVLGAPGVVASPAGSTYPYGDFVITLTK
jgi:hypothetical protein